MFIVNSVENALKKIGNIVQTAAFVTYLMIIKGRRMKVENP